jgi:hypothetical protein
MTGGILRPAFDTIERTRELSPILSRQLGRPLVHHLVTIDRSSLLSSIDLEQETVVTDRAVLGYAEYHAA